MQTSLIERAVQHSGAPAVFAALSNEERQALTYLWRAWARPSQVPPPGDYLGWLIMAGRGFGKTRTGAETTRARVEAGKAGRICLISTTPADVRDVMIEGESGLLNVCPPDKRPVYEPSKRRLTWPNGAVAMAFSSYEPDQTRGLQFDFLWADEPCKWKNPTETWDNAMFALRLGDPKAIVTTTPTPIELIRRILKDPNWKVTRGTTYENRANLAPTFFQQIVSKYEGTRLGRQEIRGELLEDVPGALWTRSNIQYKPMTDFTRVVVAIDPAVTSSEGSDETGIIAAGKGLDGMYYVLTDRSSRETPDGWARRAIQAHRDYKGDRVVGEVNNGGEMVELTLRTIDQLIPYKAVHASRGKVARAEPISALYEQCKVFHVQPFPDLEDQMCTWTPESGKSPDRLDALVWALTELSQQPGTGTVDDIHISEDKRPAFAGLRGRAF